MTDAPPAVEALELSKRFGDVLAVDGVGLAAESGALFGLLDPNGIGQRATAMPGLIDLVAARWRSASGIGSPNSASRSAVPSTAAKGTRLCQSCTCGQYSDSGLPAERGGRLSGSGPSGFNARHPVASIRQHEDIAVTVLTARPRRPQPNPL